MSVMPVRLPDFVKRLLSRPGPTRRRPTPKLGCEFLEDRVVPTAAVTVAALGNAVEGGAPALFQFLRTETDGPLTVNFSVGGTAAPGYDYDPIGSAVTFGDGEPYAYVTVAAVADVIDEPTETVSVTLNPYYYNYTVGTPSSATVNILNQQPPPAVFDLDVSANGVLGDPVDGAANYLPGYEGAVQKVSTGMNFNSDSYQVGGQQIKLVLDGIGSATPNLVKVEFELVVAETSSHPGYASNKTHPDVQGMGKQYDYSFLPEKDFFKDPAVWPNTTGNPPMDPSLPPNPVTTVTPNSAEQPWAGRQVGGQMQANRTWINLYCKDYGGATQAKVTAHYNIGGQQQLRVFTLDIPLDTDNDGLADKWELEMGARWNAQYEQTLTPEQMLNGFAPGMDAENIDPDHGGPLWGHKEGGDAHTILEEYRGYILDGGGLNGQGAGGRAGGHMRLDPARKEILVEVDHVAGLQDVPGNSLRNILDGASKVFSNADRGAGIYMYYLLDQTALNIPDNTIDTQRCSVEILARGSEEHEVVG
jgi:hypothetical protein